MRGGAIAAFVWAGLLAVLAITNAIWTTGNAIQGGMFAFAVVSIILVGVALVVLAPSEALHKGEPKPRLRPELIPSASFASMLLGIAVAMFAFGWAFGHFFVFLGGALMVASLGRLVIEHRAARRAHRLALRETWPREQATPQVELDVERERSGERVEEHAKQRAQERAEQQSRERAR